MCSINFSVLKENTDESSVMDGYTEKPATLWVEEGEKTVHLTLKNSDWIKSFQTMQGELFIDADVISVDEENDKRVVAFPINPWR